MIRPHAPRAGRATAALVATSLLTSFVAISSSAIAQNAATSTRSSAAPVAAPATKMSGGKKVLSLAEYGKWNRVTSTSLSDDGAWMTYAYQPNDGDGTLYIKQLDGDKSYTIPVGSLPQFSDDSKWVGYYVSPPTAAGRGGRGAPGAGRGGAPAAGTAATGPTRRFEVLNLATGEKTPMPNVLSFKFSPGSHWVLARTNKTVADAKHNGTDLIVRELGTGNTRNIGNVNLYDLDDTGRLLAYTVDAADRLGNGLYVMDLATNTTGTLASAVADFDQLVWSDKGANLAVLRGDKKSTNKQKDNTLLVWSNVASDNQKAIVYDPAKDAAFPKGMVVSEYTAPRFTRDGSRIVFGIKDQDVEPAKNDEPQANVDIWHYKDPEPQSQQMVRIAQERRSTQPAELILGANRFMRLADSSMRNVTVAPNGKWGIGRLDAPYRLEVSWGGTKSDVYRVNMETGERTMIDKALTRTMGTSPDSRWFLYLRNKQTIAYNLATGAKVNLDVVAGRSSLISRSHSR